MKGTKKFKMLTFKFVFMNFDFISFEAKCYSKLQVGPNNSECNVHFFIKSLYMYSYRLKWTISKAITSKIL